jgi:prevent-host-death family protein
VLWQRGVSLDNSHLDGYLVRMAEYSIAEARNNFPKLINRMLAGEDVTITKRGKAVGRLIPTASQAMTIDVEWLDSVRVKPRDPNFDAVDLVRKMRDEDPY